MMGVLASTAAEGSSVSAFTAHLNMKGHLSKKKVPKIRDDAIVEA